MSNDQLHADVKVLLEKNGAMGVNQLSKELDIPLSTMQKYMDKDQTYFKKNSARKWVLPEVSAVSDMSSVSSNYSNIIDSQLMSMNALIDTLMAQFRATVTLIEANRPLMRPVTGKATNKYPIMDKVDNFVKSMEKAIKEYKNKIPEEYQELMLNLDIASMVINMGLDYISSKDCADITGLLLGDTETLTENSLKIIERHQK